MSELIKHVREVGFTFVAQPHDYHVDYTLYDIEGWTEDDQPMWHKAGAVAWPHPVESLSDAEPYLHGHVKWDGCSNWHFDEQDRLMLHACSREGLMRLGEAMALCWDWTAELCPNWTPD